MSIPVHKNSPLFPASKVTISLTASPDGLTKDWDSFALSNNYDTVMDITELRFFVMPNPLKAVKYSSDNGLWTQFDFGAMLAAKLGTTKVSFTNEFVHLRSFAEPTQWDLNNNYDLSASFIPYNSSYYGWKFKKPVSIRPGDGLRASLRLDPQALWPVDPTVVNPDYDPPAQVFTGLDVWIAAVGRLNDEPLPDALEYPMAMEWSPIIQPNGGSTQAYPSFAATGENQFRNQRLSDMRVDRLVASLYSRFTPTDPDAPGSAYSLPIDVLNYLTGALDCQLKDTHGYSITPQRVPLSSLVDPRSGNAKFQTVLKYNEQFPMQLFANTVPAALFPAGSDAGIQPILFPHVTVIGTQWTGVPR